MYLCHEAVHLEAVTTLPVWLKDQRVVVPEGCSYYELNLLRKAGVGKVKVLKPKNLRLESLLFCRTR